MYWSTRSVRPVSLGSGYDIVQLQQTSVVFLFFYEKQKHSLTLGLLVSKVGIRVRRVPQWCQRVSCVPTYKMSYVYAGFRIGTGTGRSICEVRSPPGRNKRHTPYVSTSCSVHGTWYQLKTDWYLYLA
jgi:hypothetical protein